MSLGWFLLGVVIPGALFFFIGYVMGYARGADEGWDAAGEAAAFDLREGLDERL